MADSASIERLTSEGFISMADAAKLYGRRTHKSTPTRHAQKGVKLPDGRVVRLEAVRVSGALCTSRAAVLRFFAAQNGATDTGTTTATPTPAQQSRAAKHAAKEAASIFQK